MEEEMNIQIKSRFTAAVLFEHDSENNNIRLTLELAVKSGANLYGANLFGANLRGANLDGANLDGEKIKKSPLSVVGLRYWCLISDGFMRLGCKRFTHDEWANFTDDEISGMDTGALEFWKQWKAPLIEMCAAHKPATEEVTA